LHDKSDGKGDIGTALRVGEGGNCGDPWSLGLLEGAACHGGHHAEAVLCGLGRSRDR